MYMTESIFLSSMHPKTDKKTTGQTQGQTQDIDRRKSLVSLKMTECYQQIVFNTALFLSNNHQINAGYLAD